MIGLNNCSPDSWLNSLLILFFFIAARMLSFCCSTLAFSLTSFCHLFIDIFLRYIYQAKKMKIPNYDPSLTAKSNYKQGHPCMPADTFRMLICGPSNSGKTNILLHMLYKLLAYDKIYLSAKNLHQDKYQYMIDDFDTRVNPVTGYNVIEGANDVIPLEVLPTDNQKIVIFDDMVCESNQRDIIEYFINGRHRNCSVIYLSQSYFKVPKNIRDNCSHFCVFGFLPRENNRIADELGIDRELLERATNTKYSFLYHDRPKKTTLKNFDEDI